MKKINSKTKQGLILVNVLVFAVIVSIITSALVSWSGTVLKSIRQLSGKEQAFQIAESGVEYYRWHLAHDPLDFYDGNASTTAQPYVHTFQDVNGNTVGQYALTITPPPVGSTMVIVKSKATLASDPTVTRTIQAKMAIPSLAKYAMVTNSNVYYGPGDKVYGPIHSNGGVGFFSGSPTPIAYNLVTSALPKFTDSGGAHFGVYTSIPTADPTPPANYPTATVTVPTRLDVFPAGRTFPVASVDFAGITTDLSAIKTKAIASGFYRTASGGSAQGYKVVLKTNGTFDLYKVTSLLSNGSCTNNPNNQTGWGTWSVSGTTLLGTYNFPSNGLMFFEDNVWVEGQVNNARITIVAGAFSSNPAQYKNIIVNNNLTYTNFDGKDVVGLIAEGNFLVGMASADNLTIDAAIIAQKGQTIRYYYTGTGCTWKLRTTLTTYGMFASYGQGYFYYTSGSGYQNQPASYDANLLYSPPPSFPLTTDKYSIISWQEVK